MTLPKTISVAACLFVWALPAFPQETPATLTPQPEPTIGLDELVLLAKHHNPQLPLARETAEAARQRAATLRSLPNPTLQIVPGFSGDAAARDEEIILAQPLDLFGQRRAQRRVLEARARAAQAGATLAERELIVAVKAAAADLFAAQEGEDLARAQTDIARRFLAAARRRAELGEVPAVQAQRAELELARIENDLAVAATERLVRRATLNQIVGQSPESPLRVAFPADQVGGALAGDALAAQRNLLRPRLDSRPDILSAGAELEANRAAIVAAARQRFPQVELQARRDTVTRGGGSTALRAVVSVPLFDFGALSHEKKAAQAQARAQEAQLASLRTRAAAELESALLRMEQRRATVENYRARLVPQTLDLLRKTQLGFDQGASSYLEVLEAQRTARQVQAEYLQVLVGAWNAETALESALGANLPPDTSPDPQIP